MPAVAVVPDKRIEVTFRTSVPWVVRRVIVDRDAAEDWMALHWGHTWDDDRRCMVDTDGWPATEEQYTRAAIEVAERQWRYG